MTQARLGRLEAQIRPQLEVHACPARGWRPQVATVVEALPAGLETRAIHERNQHASRASDRDHPYRMSPLQQRFDDRLAEPDTSARHTRAGGEAGSSVRPRAAQEKAPSQG